MFISFEGGEGAGKTTQAKKLVCYLKASGYRVIYTREPGGTALGGKLRHVLQDSASAVTPLAELLLYAADRAQHVEQVIIPALRAEEIVVCDRYCDAGVAYQGYGRGLELDMIERINRWAVQGILPDLTILLDIAPEAGLARIMSDKKPLDRLEREQLDFHQRVRAGYLKLAAQQPRRFRVIDANRDVPVVSEHILNEIKPLLLSPAVGTY